MLCNKMETHNNIPKTNQKGSKKGGEKISPPSCFHVYGSPTFTDSRIFT